MDFDLLVGLGLSRNEAKAYLALIELKVGSVSEIARKANIPRVNTYDVLDSLKTKGLVGVIRKSNKQYFEPANPSALEELRKKREKELSQTKDLIENLSENFISGSVEQDVLVFQGKLGLKTVLKEALESTTEILNFGSSGKFPEFYKEYYSIWETQRIKNKINMRIIAPKDVKAPKKKLQEIRFLKEKFQNLTSTFIFEDKVAVFFWKENPIAIIIKDKDYAETNKNYFEQLWKQTI